MRLKTDSYKSILASSDWPPSQVSKCIRKWGEAVSAEQKKKWRGSISQLDPAAHSHVFGGRGIINANLTRNFGRVMISYTCNQTKAMGDPEWPVEISGWDKQRLAPADCKSTAIGCIKTAQQGGPPRRARRGGPPRKARRGGPPRRAWRGGATPSLPRRPATQRWTHCRAEASAEPISVKGLIYAPCHRSTAGATGLIFPSRRDQDEVTALHKITFGFSNLSNVGSFMGPLTTYKGKLKFWDLVAVFQLSITHIDESGFSGMN